MEYKNLCENLKIRKKYYMENNIEEDPMDFFIGLKNLFSFYKDDYVTLITLDKILEKVRFENNEFILEDEKAIKTVKDLFKKVQNKDFSIEKDQMKQLQKIYREDAYSQKEEAQEVRAYMNSSEFKLAHSIILKYGADAIFDCLPKDYSKGELEQFYSKIKEIDSKTTDKSPIYAVMDMVSEYMVDELKSNLVSTMQFMYAHKDSIKSFRKEIDSEKFHRLNKNTVNQMFDQIDEEFTPFVN